MRPELIFALVASIAICAHSALRSGHVTLMVDQGYDIEGDAKTSYGAGQANISIEQGACLLSCPGVCSYSIVTPQGHALVLARVDTIDLTAAIATSQMSPFSTDPRHITAMLGYDWSDTSQFALVVKVGATGHALVITDSITVKPFDPNNTCFGYEIYSISFSYVYQPDGSLVFGVPSAVAPRAQRHAVRPAFSPREGEVKYTITGQRVPTHCPGTAPVDRSSTRILFTW